MGRTVSIGADGFCDIRENNYFYVDKTSFIKEWWFSGDKVTLITRPRRFGKTLNMSMLDCFFSNKYEGRSDLFEGLKIWEDEKYRKIQGTWPVIFLSFAGIKGKSYNSALNGIKAEIERIYQENSFLIDREILDSQGKAFFKKIGMDMTDDEAVVSLKKLCYYLNKYYGKKVIILLDEYDTPMQEAWLGGYWDEFTGFIRSLFNSTFKTNPYLERAVMTGITRVSKESIFSDLNNLNVVTTTCNQYVDCFGFTEEEVFCSLDEMQMSSEKDGVKAWFDGFTFGTHKDIYNPWSIINFLKHKKYKQYWANSSTNELISELLINSGKEMKKEMEILLKGKTIEKELDEQIVLNQLKKRKNAIWSLFLATGYLSIEELTIDKITYKELYKLRITNQEVMEMFESMIIDWFDEDDNNYNNFIKAMLENDLELMNIYMNEVALNTFSYFDSGKNPSGKTEPEKFYHGFVLGLLVDLRDRYEIKSNRESGYGRYDICLIPLNENDSGIVIEFKVFDAKREKSLEDTVVAALKQIEDKKYDTVLLEKGISQDRIHHYGFAFQGNEVLIGE